MRLAVSGPRKWKSIEKRLPNQAILVRQWIGATLSAQQLKGENPEVATSLQLGLDSQLAEIARDLGIPYHVFLACDDQDNMWDESARDSFSSLLSNAASTTRIVEGTYVQGCIVEQTKAITSWMLEEPSMLLVVRNGSLTKSQSNRIATLQSHSQIQVLRVKEPWMR